MACGWLWPRMTRCCVRRSRGMTVFLFSHTGDGVAAAFASPRSAVDAAVASQRAVELPVRMGLATGEAELRDGDYFGTVLNRRSALLRQHCTRRRYRSRSSPPGSGTPIRRSPCGPMCTCRTTR